LCDNNDKLGYVVKIEVATILIESFDLLVKISQQQAVVEAVGTRDQLGVSDEAAGYMLYTVRHFVTECSGGADGHANRSAANTTATMMMMMIIIIIIINNYYNMISKVVT